MSKNPRLRLRSGDLVKVRSFEEIAATLEDDSTLEGLPFQPEMRKYCGRTLRVLQPVKKLIIEYAKPELRWIRNTVILEYINCDGEAHSGCDSFCYFLWKEAWLSRPGDQRQSSLQGDKHEVVPSSKNFRGPSALASDCQPVALEKATHPLPAWDIRQYIWDLTDSTAPFLKRIFLICVSLARHIKRLIGVRLPYRFSGSLKKTPSSVFDLKPGDRIEVKNLDEIRATLDGSGKNRGLFFTKEMKRFCGQQFTVLKPVDKIIIEETGEMQKLSHTVILEGANCDGTTHFGCSRNCYLLWRKIWLKKV